MEPSYLDKVNVAELTQAATEQRKIVLVLRASDGVLEDVFGGPILPGLDPAVAPKGSWYSKEESVYVDDNGTWKKVSAPNRMVLVIQASDGTLLSVNGPWAAASDPAVSPKGSWYWKTSSPGCTYVSHFGVWKKVCD